MAGNLVRVVSPDGTRGTLPEERLMEAISEGYTPEAEYDAKQREAALQAEYGGAGGQAIAGVQGALRGATLGLSDAASAALTGALTPEGPQLTPEARARAKELGIQVPEQQSAFGVGYGTAREMQEGWRETNRGTAIASEIAGAALPTLIGGPLAAAPSALAERLGASAARGVAGTAPGLARAAVAGGVGGAVEGGISGLVVGASQLTPDEWSNPEYAAEQVLSSVSEGVLIGGAMGTVFGGAARALRGGASELDRIAVQATPPPQPAQAIPTSMSLDDLTAVQDDLINRPMLAEQVPDAPRGKLQALVERQRAAQGGFERALSEGTAKATAAYDAILRGADEIDVHAGIAAKKVANSYNVGHPVQAPEITQMFADMRSEISAFTTKYPAQSLSSGGGLAAIKGLTAELDQTEAMVVEALSQGRIGDAYGLLDQSVKGYVGKAADATKSKLVRDMARNLYSRPRQLLEDDAIWGDAFDAATGQLSMSGRQKLVNPTWSKRIAVAQDEKLSQFSYRSGERSANGWDNARRANDTGMAGFLREIGNDGTQQKQIALRTHARATVEDAINRTRAWGTPELQAKAAEMAAHRKVLEDTLDHVAAVKRDAIAGGAQLQSATMDVLAGVAGMASTPAGFAIAAGKGIVRGAIASAAELGMGAKAKMASAASTLVSGAARAVERAAAPAIGAAAVYGAMLPDDDHAKAVTEAQALSRAGSPETQAFLERAAEIERDDPQFAESLAAKTFQRAAYIASKLPVQRGGPSVFAEPPQLDPVSDRKLRRTVAAAYMPAAAVDRLARGVGSPEDLEAVKRLYPAMYRDFQGQVQQQLKRSPKPPAYSDRVRIAQVAGIATDPSMRPLSVARAQQVAAMPDQRKAGEDQAQAQRKAEAPPKFKRDRDSVYAARADELMTR